MKKIISFLLFMLLVIGVIIVYIFVSASFNKSRTYYFPQIETYLRIYKPPFNKYGYVIFSKDSDLSFSEKIDFVKIYKTEMSDISFIFNHANTNEIFIVDRWNNAQIKQVNFVMEKINRTDTTIFEKDVIAGVIIQILKKEYFELNLEGYLNAVFYIDYDIGDCLIEAEPIKE